ncbi:MAG: response regulator transcription factor [Actinomycetota bacterium]|nr:response regulator transcription factor [Actinomycetota bacterium]
MNDTQTIVLVAEHDETTRAFLLDNLAADGYHPLGAQTEEETRVKLRNHSPALVVLGRLEAERGPVGLMRGIRSGEAGCDPSLSVIVLGERGDEPELLRSFEAGCDHFMAKPFSYVELLARVRACLRRARVGHIGHRLVVGALVVERDQRRAHHAGRELSLTRREFELLAQLAADPTRVFTKWELLRDLWGFRAQGNTRTLDAHACRLRKKLAGAGAPHLVHNTRGVGYRLSLGSVPASAKRPAMVASHNGHAA